MLRSPNSPVHDSMSQTPLPLGQRLLSTYDQLNIPALLDSNSKLKDANTLLQEALFNTNKQCEALMQRENTLIADYSSREEIFLKEIAYFKSKLPLLEMLEAEDRFKSNLIAELKAQLAQHEASFDHWNHRENEHRRLIERLEKTIEDLQKTIEDLQNNLNDKTLKLSNVSDLKKELANAERDKGLLKESLQTMEEELKRLKDGANKERKDNEQKMHSLQSSLKHKQSQLDDFIRELSELKSYSLQKNDLSERENRENEWLLLQKHWSIQETSLQTQITTLEQKNSSLKVSIEDSRVTIENLEESVKQLQRKVKLDTDELLARKLAEISALKHQHESHIISIREQHENAISGKIKMWEESEKCKQKVVTAYEMLKASQSVPLLSHAMDDRIR